MTSNCLACGAIAAVLLGTVASPVSAQDVPRGAALLALAQRAIGDAKALAGVRTLQVTGTFRRVVDNSDTEGDFEVFIELPDKYLRNEKTGTPGQPSTETIEALVGTEVRDTVRGGGGRGGGRGGANGVPAGADGSPPGDLGDDPAAGRRDGGRDGGQGDTPPAEVDAVPGPATGPGPGSGADPDAQRRVRQADVSRLLLMWLLKTEVPPAWVGIAESPDGKADVLETRYADGRPTRLFLDSSTHMPLMMQWESASPEAGGAGARRGAAGRIGGGGQRGGGQRGGAADGAAARQGGPPPLVTFDMTFSDHREVSGIRLPYVITRGTNGQTRERWAISRYRVNQTLGAETFTR